MEKGAPEEQPQAENKEEEKGSQAKQEALQTEMKDQTAAPEDLQSEGPHSLKPGQREKSRWLALLREAEVIAANLKESGTRR
jgi:hypothetical protein